MLAEDAASSKCDWQIDREEPCLIVCREDALPIVGDFINTICASTAGVKVVGQPLE